MIAVGFRGAYFDIGFSKFGGLLDNDQFANNLARMPLTRNQNSLCFDCERVTPTVSCDSCRVVLLLRARAEVREFDFVDVNPSFS
jgi:hypothetical protein